MHCVRTGRYTLITCHPKRGTKGIDAAGVLGRFGGVAVHDAWAPYDTHADVGHQLCCAHALRELAAVTDTAPADADWCWATQAADALVAVQNLMAEATAAGADTIAPDVLDTQVRLYRSAVRIGATQTSARTSAESSVVVPARRPVSTSAWRTHLRTVSAEPTPSFWATAPIAAHCES